MGALKPIIEFDYADGTDGEDDGFNELDVGMDDDDIEEAADSLSALSMERARDAPGIRGYLLKKAGGKGGVKSSKLRANIAEKWTKRYFVLPPTISRLSYYTSEEDYKKGADALGTVECLGSTIFLKDIVGEVHRFTIAARERELKLKADSAGEYARWAHALGYFGKVENAQSSRSTAARSQSSASMMGNPATSLDSKLTVTPVKEEDEEDEDSD
mmetsp:Transcript_1831/g.2816  ORF Transcript_1831/g.2816 Transcript_1831/m.2816 type:complete len:215 (-) Transcript_1831:303-947(-)